MRLYVDKGRPALVVNAGDAGLTAAALSLRVFCILWAASVATTAQAQAPSQTPDMMLRQAPDAASSPDTARSLDAVSEQLRRLVSAVAQQQEQLRQSREEITALRQQVVALEGKLATASPREQGDANAEAARLTEQVAVLREQQELQSSELATHEQTKVETESKYPVRLTGLILANAFNNSAGVDVIQSPTLALSGSGSTGITLLQTVLGLDARGPHLAGAPTHADVRVDFFGLNAASGASMGVGSYGATGGILRLRTAHATIDWAHAHGFAELDRPIVSPETPTSLTAVAQPALAWSGNLWNWVPQFGGEYRWPLSSEAGLEIKAALVDVPNPPAYATAAATNTAGTVNVASSAVSYAEQSRWPGSEIHVAYSLGHALTGARFGAGGYFSPHEAKGSFHYDAWAATLDYHLPLGHWLGANGGFYRGLALGGLGGGAYKDYVYTITPAGQYSFERPLDAVGGWSQLKARAGQRLEFNADFGLDDAFARELRPFAVASSGTYANLARNATFFSNTIYSPTAYTLFSFEYRRLSSTPITGARATSNVFGIAAGYKF